jgi:hypothetical protein
MKLNLIPIVLLLALCCLTDNAIAQRSRNPQRPETLDTMLPVRGLCLGAPQRKNIDKFINFINDELAPNKINTLILRVDFGYEYESHPDLRSGNPLTQTDVNNLVEACRHNNIKLIPHFQLLGHQSWDKQTGKLLQVHPEFDETPHVITENYTKWPNADGLYCKSYCPLHPDVHAVVFALIDELLDVFEATDLHGGMDEVFYIGDAKCPRCSGKDKSELFAGEVNKIREHLAEKNRRLWIWGDRLIDGRETGLGEWEGATNDTYRAIDKIAKDVVICDWHYNRAELTNVLFAAKDLDVVSCPWKKPNVVAQQIEDMIAFRKQTNRKMSKHFQGVIQTVWGSAEGFIQQYEQEKRTPTTDPNAESEGVCFMRMLNEIKNIKPEQTIVNDNPVR